MTEEIEKWLSDPEFGADWQDMDLVLAQMDCLPRLKDYLNDPAGTELKKTEVISAMLEILEHEVSRLDPVAFTRLNNEIVSVIRSHRDLARNAARKLGMPNEVLLERILEPDSSCDTHRPNSRMDPFESRGVWRQVYFHEYLEPMDLSGKDVLGLIQLLRNDLSKTLGRLVPRSEMQQEELPDDYLTSLTGEIADEVHEWPNATIGQEQRHLILQLRMGKPTLLQWKIQSPASPAKKSFWKPW